MQSRKYRVSETRRRSSVSEGNNEKFNKTFKMTILVVFLLCLIIIIVSCISWKNNSNKSSSKTNNTYRSEKYREEVIEKEYTNEREDISTYVTTTKKPDTISSTIYQSLKTNQLDISQSTSHNSTSTTNDFRIITSSSTNIGQTTTSSHETSPITNYNKYSSNKRNDMSDNNTPTPYYNEFMTTHANNSTYSKRNDSYEVKSTTILDMITTYNRLLITSNSTTHNSNKVSYDSESTTKLPFVEVTENNYVSTIKDDNSLTTENKYYETSPTTSNDEFISKNYDYNTTNSTTNVDLSTTELNSYKTTVSENDVSVTQDSNDYTTDVGETNPATSTDELITKNYNYYMTDSTTKVDLSTTELNSYETTFSENDVSITQDSNDYTTDVEKTSPATNNDEFISKNYDYNTTNSTTNVDLSTTELNSYETTVSENDVSVTQDSNDYTTDVEETSPVTSTDKFTTEDDDYDTITTKNIDNEFQTTSTNMNQPSIFGDVTEKMDQDDNFKVHICESGNCKRLASKMLSLMNHSVDPCEDLYEYACGGLESDPQIISRDLSKQVLDQIEKSLQMHVDNKWYQPFVKYMDSCIKYDEYLLDNEKFEEVRKTVESVGSFYTQETWPKDRNYSDILSHLIAETILNNNPLLFDIVPNVHELNSQKFILQVIPTIGNSKYFYDSIKQNMYVQKYNDNITQWMKEVESSFKKIKKFITDEDININFQTLQQYFVSYPSSTSYINEVLEGTDYSILTINELHSQTSLIQWTSIIYKITGIILEQDAQIQIYFNHQIFNALKNVEHSNESQQIEFYNALLGLYATNLYKQMVHNRIHSNEQCLSIAIKFLPSQSSSLYMSALSKIQLYYFEQLIDDIFMELKETLRLKFKQLQWANIEGQEYLLKKLADIKLSLPDTLIYNGSPEQLTDNFFTNTLVLMKKYRESMYSVLKSDPNDPKELWTYFASPFQTSPQTIHSLSIILIPFGAIDWFSFQYYREFDHFIFASIGNLLAREIAHFFDTHGMQYWNKTRVGSPFAHINDDWTKAAYHEFINCQRDILFHESIEITIPLSNQPIQYRVPLSTLNERLADVIGIKLAQETLNRIHTSHVSKLLPWLPLNTHQLFFLTYVQTYCTKSRLEDFNTFSYEKSTLPSRIRILAVAVNNKNIGQAWNCPEGSLTLPIPLCEIFPDLNHERDMMENVEISIN